MNTDIIRQQIDQAILVEQETGNLIKSLQEAASAKGIRLSNQDMTNLFMFIQDYVQHVPALLDKLETAARQQQTTTQIIPILNAVQKYFSSARDVIPDRLGLLGLLDDAYIAHRLIQEISDRFAKKTGHPMLPLDMTQANSVVRELIGEPHASLLDAGVNDELEHPNMQNSLLSLLDTSGDFRMTGPDPTWGDANISEILDAQAGAWGIS